jgi:hypothetical protein
MIKSDAGYIRNVILPVEGTTTEMLVVLDPDLILTAVQHKSDVV